MVFFPFRDNLITNSQPVPKPNIVTATIYENSTKTVSSCCLALIIHKKFQVTRLTK